KIYLTQKDTTGALGVLEKGLALFEDNVDLLSLHIDILLMQKKHDLARKRLEEAVEISPDNDRLHAVLAHLYEKINEPARAEQHYQKAIQINPENILAQFNLGALYFNQGTDWYNKAGTLPPTEKKKIQEYENKSDDADNSCYPAPDACFCVQINTNQSEYCSDKF
ncbi:MAG: tetratricopeptide repeat protein, partial [Flammeovirgaceae bacterium]|nr:tetratricopeptide repeat protein [Flammeovirgaceae bacterium]